MKENKGQNKKHPWARGNFQGFTTLEVIVKGRSELHGKDRK